MDDIRRTYFLECLLLSGYLSLRRETYFEGRVPIVSDADSGVCAVAVCRFILLIGGVMILRMGF